MGLKLTTLVVTGTDCTDNCKSNYHTITAQMAQTEIWVDSVIKQDALYNIKRKKYKTVCAELPFAKVTFDRMVMIFYRTCNVFFICYAVRLLQYSKSVWSKVGTLTVYMLINCILMPENCFRSGKSCKMYTLFTKVSFQHFKIK